MAKKTKPITRIEFWRVSLGLSFEQLGEKLGVSAQAAFRYCVHPDQEQHRRPNKASGRALHIASDGKIHSDNYSDLVCRRTGADLVASHAIGVET